MCYVRTEKKSASQNASEQDVTASYLHVSREPSKSAQEDCLLFIKVARNPIQLILMYDLGSGLVLKMRGACQQLP